MVLITARKKGVSSEDWETFLMETAGKVEVLPVIKNEADGSAESICRKLSG